MAISIRLSSIGKCETKERGGNFLVDEQLRVRLDSEPWDDHLARLTLYAQNLMRKLSWRGVVNGPVPGGKEAQDFAKDAICDVYSGTRKWNPQTHPELIRFLFDAVKSEVSNTITSKSNQEVREDPARPDAGQFDDDTALAILDYIQDEADLYRYAEAILDGYDDRASIAEHLGIPPTEVDNLRKRMKRRLNAFYKETNDHDQ